eukprot:TRINITY_DN18382_c0_g1_i1.p1 TRINITY_DN18382_c0_g1~~TRINITY_DN18382_c0_g1_i1.p1  ORF type:complete len:214 (-),score=46.81 TRINITY_DN18382_c0_g1_i1:56-697(-)
MVVPLHKKKPLREQQICSGDIICFEIDDGQPSLVPDYYKNIHAKQTNRTTVESIHPTTKLELQPSIIVVRHFCNDFDPSLNQNIIFTESELKLKLQTKMKERNEKLKEKAEKEVVNLQQRIKLNVGGYKYETTLATLNVVSSMLSVMFSGNFTQQPDEDGYHFIDRNGDLFGDILDYLRNISNPVLPRDYIRLKRLKTEAEYFGLVDLVKQIG